MTDLLDRVAARISLGLDSDCWEWTGRPNSAGYGRITVNGRESYAHRFVYESLVGPIPKGLQLDHLCRNRICVNPDHLEPVTNRQNWERGEHPAAVVVRTGVCNRGHSMDDAYVNRSTGWRVCRTCKLEYVRNRQHLN